MDWFMGKGRRKDKDSPTPPVGSGDEQPTKQYLEESCLRQRVIDADLVKLVQLPPSLDTNEWLATHTISFFNHINLMYGVVSEYCTSDSCASMVGPDNAQYHWQDEKGKKVKQSAPQYIDHMMSYVQKSVTDETLFPTKFGQEFPAGFPDTVRKIHRYLFHVVAHLYHSHTGLLVTLGLQGHLNTLFVHFMLFSSLFQLLPGKEAEVLMDLHNGLLKAMQEDPNQNTHEGGSDSGAAADDDDAATATASSSKEGSPQSENASSPVGGGGCGGGGGGGHSDLASSPSSQTVCSSAVAGSSSPSSSSPPPPHGQKTGSALTSAESKGSGSTRSSGSENGASATGTGVKKTSAAGVVDIPSPSS